MFEMHYATETRFALLGNLVLGILSRLGLGAGFRYIQGRWITWPPRFGCITQLEYYSHVRKWGCRVQ